MRGHHTGAILDFLSHLECKKKSIIVKEYFYLVWKQQDSVPKMSHFFEKICTIFVKICGLAENAHAEAVRRSAIIASQRRPL
jgi:hypothetical protein